MLYRTHLLMETIKGHDRSKEEEGEVEVVLDQIHETVVTIFLLTVLKSKAHTAHNGEAAAPVEQDVLQIKGARRKAFLH